MTRAKRRSTMKKLAASTALVGGALALTFGGAFAAFTDTVSAGPETISTGTIVIGTGTNTANTTINNIVPGDSITREIDLNSTGSTANLSQITLGFTATTSSLLDTDPTWGLQVTAQSCPTAWTVTGTAPPIYTCSNPTSLLIGTKASQPVATLESTPAVLTPSTGGTSLKSLTAGGTDYLVFTLTFPANAPGDMSQEPKACFGSPGGSATTENLEGCTSVLKYIFTGQSRAGQPE